MYWDMNPGTQINFKGLWLWKRERGKDKTEIRRVQKTGTNLSNIFVITKEINCIQFDLGKIGDYYGIYNTC